MKIVDPRSAVDRMVSLSQKLKFWGSFASLRNTLLIVFILFAITIIGLSTAAGIFFGTQSSQGSVFEELITEVELDEQAIDNWLDERIRDLAVITNNSDDVERARQVLALSPIKHTTAYNAFLERLQVETEITSRFDEIFLMDTQGQVVLSTDEFNLGKIHKDQAYFQNGLQKSFISSPIFSLSRGENEIYITIPFIDRAGKVIGVLAGRLNLAHLAQIISARTRSTQTGETYLVSQNHRFLTEPYFEPNSRAARSEGIEQALRLDPNRNGRGIYENYNGVRVIGVYRWLPELGVVLISERTERESLAGVQQLVLFNGLVAVLVLLVAVGVALFVTSRITKPIASLTEVATAITQGELDRTVSIKANNEIGLLAQAFNTMAERLRRLIDTLEDRIRERTRDLEISAEISRQMTGILDLEELLKYVVNHVHEAYNFYHTHVYLIEEETDDLFLAEGYGEIGESLKTADHRLSAGQGIVGTVASTNEHFLSNDVNEVLNFVRNELLPETNSELAVPLRKGEKVLGVLDVQSKEFDRFSPTDVTILQSIANQLAVAIDNIRLLESTQQALQEVERLNRRLMREGWAETAEETRHRVYRFIREDRGKVSPAPNVWLPAMKEAVAQKRLITQIIGNGSPKAAELAVPLMLRGEMIGVVGVKKDEASKWTEEELTAVEAVANQTALALENARLSEEQEKTIVQLRDVDRLKSEFLTSMSHELRTPLNSIIGFADILLQGIDGPLDEQALTDINAIHNSGKHLLALINDILDLSKIEAGRMELAHSALSISDVFAEVTGSVSSLLTKKPVDLIVDVPEMLPRVWADPLRLSQVLINLVSNAIKFTEEGSVTMKAWARDDNLVEISVSDTGIGIPEDKFDLIFEHFRQVDSRTNKKFQGTGMGLAIARQLVELHGGEMWLESVVGKGATFTFTIPVAPEEQMAEA
jgi:signal transduction histidine kinase